MALGDNRIGMELRVSYRSKSVIVRSEAAAKRWARKTLGVSRVYETATGNGWQYWVNRDPEDNDDPVTVRVL
jgi:hypothetical protein